MNDSSLSAVQVNSFCSDVNIEKEIEYNFNRKVLQTPQTNKGLTIKDLQSEKQPSLVIKHSHILGKQNNIPNLSSVPINQSRKITLHKASSNTNQPSYPLSSNPLTYQNIASTSSAQQSYYMSKISQLQQQCLLLRKQLSMKQTSFLKEKTVLINKIEIFNFQNIQLKQRNNNLIQINQTITQALGEVGGKSSNNNGNNFTNNNNFISNTDNINKIQQLQKKINQLTLTIKQKSNQLSSFEQSSSKLSSTNCQLEFKLKSSAEHCEYLKKSIQQYKSILKQSNQRKLQSDEKIIMFQKNIILLKNKLKKLPIKDQYMKQVYGFVDNMINMTNGESNNNYTNIINIQNNTNQTSFIDRLKNNQSSHLNLFDQRSSILSKNQSNNILTSYNHLNQHQNQQFSQQYDSEVNESHNYHMNNMNNMNNINMNMNNKILDDNIQSQFSASQISGIHSNNYNQYSQNNNKNNKLNKNMNMNLNNMNNMNNNKNRAINRVQTQQQSYQNNNNNKKPHNINSHNNDLQQSITASQQISHQNQNYQQPYQNSHQQYLSSSQTQQQTQVYLCQICQRVYPQESFISHMKDCQQYEQLLKQKKRIQSKLISIKENQYDMRKSSINGMNSSAIIMDKSRSKGKFIKVKDNQYSVMRNNNNNNNKNSINYNHNNTNDKSPRPSIGKQSTSILNNNDRHSNISNGHTYRETKQRQKGNKTDRYIQQNIKQNDKSRLELSQLLNISDISSRQSYFHGNQNNHGNKNKIKKALINHNNANNMVNQQKYFTSNNNNNSILPQSYVHKQYPQIKYQTNIIHNNNSNNNNNIGKQSTEQQLRRIVQQLNENRIKGQNNMMKRNKTSGNGQYNHNMNVNMNYNNNQNGQYNNQYQQQQNNSNNNKSARTHSTSNNHSNNHKNYYNTKNKAEFY